MKKKITTTKTVLPCETKTINGVRLLPGMIYEEVVYTDIEKTEIDKGGE